MIIIKAILILLLIFFAVCKISEGISNTYLRAMQRLVNLIEIVVSILLIFYLYKI